MHELTQKIKAFAQAQGIDLLGFASHDRFKDIEAQKNPLSIFPEAKTVILLGRRICRGSLRGVEEGTNFGDYTLFGRNWLEDEFLALSAYDLTNFIESHGWEAVPVFPNPTEVTSCGIPVAPDKAAPNVHPDFDYAAVACGLCTISYSGLPFSKEFGSRQRFHMILTDAALESTPLLEENPCNGCKTCADVCPFGAISKEETEEIEICGKTFNVGKINYDLCRICQNGAVKNRFASDAKPDRIAALCNRTCLCGLEERGALKNTFATPFRKRKPWTIDQTKSESKTAPDVLGGAFSKSGK